MTAEKNGGNGGNGGDQRPEEQDRAPKVPPAKRKPALHKRAGKSGKKLASSPCLLDEDDPEIDPRYLG